MEIELLPVTRKDVDRIITWLQDEEIIDNWFGRYSYGDPAHLGYHPEEILDAPENEWERVFDNSEHRIFSIITKRFYTSLLINTLIILALERQMKEEVRITCSMFL